MGYENPLHPSINESEGRVPSGARPFPAEAYRAGDPAKSLVPPEDMADKKVFSSGATSSVGMPPIFFIPWEGEEMTAYRFEYGNVKHEKSTPIYAEANWLKAFHARDVEFFRERASHAVRHIRRELRGSNDPGPGGNLGAVGWFQAVFAFVKKYDPELYAAIQGLQRLDATKLRKSCACPVCESTKPLETTRS